MAIRSSWRCLTMAAMTMTLCATGQTTAGEIMTFQFDLPEAPLAFFGQQYTADYFVQSNKIIGGEIVETRMHLEFNTENAAGSIPDAADLLVEFQPPVDGLPFWGVSGADLGWSGTGEFVGDISTDELNLPIIDLPPDSLSLWFVRITSLNDADPFLGGQLMNSYIEVDVIPGPPALAAFGVFGLLAHRRCRRR